MYRSIHITKFKKETVLQFFQVGQLEVFSMQVFDLNQQLFSPNYFKYLHLDYLFQIMFFSKILWCKWLFSPKLLFKNYKLLKSKRKLLQSTSVMLVTQIYYHTYSQRVYIPPTRMKINHNGPPLEKNQKIYKIIKEGIL